MKQPFSKKKRQMGIVINFSSLILSIILYEIFKSTGFSGLILLSLATLLSACLWSFISVYARTGLWAKTHMKTSKLDEREILVHSNALRISYSIFVVITLLVVYAYALAEKRPIDVVIAGGLLYFAHVLPASIIGWTERDV